MKAFKGIIALDIDGTITVQHATLDASVSDYLNGLIVQGWRLIFITGRTFSFAMPILSSIKGDYFFAVQNGAALYAMPQGSCLTKHSIPTSLLRSLDPIFQKSKKGLLVESGKENADVCYYKPQDFSPEEESYLTVRKKISPEKWREITSFEELPIPDFAVGKYFAFESEAREIAERILLALPLNVTVISDPFRPGFYLAHINAWGVSKGQILEEFIAMHPAGLPVIAAGDDYNDVEMLEKSMIKIVMQNAPAPLREIADIVAPPASEQGIIQGLEEALWKVSSK